MNLQKSDLVELHKHVAPIIGNPAWGTKQGIGSFLTFEFGHPELIIKERHSEKIGLSRSAYVQGEWHVWIYCCAWRFSSHGDQIAGSENNNNQISRAASMLDGQKLMNVSLVPEKGRSTFKFDLGGLLERWPAGNDTTEEQWFIYGPENVFAYRADGNYMLHGKNVASDLSHWRAFE